jgi:hypothetical protein
MESTPSPPLWEVLELSFSVNLEDARLVTFCNGHRVIIDLDAEYFTTSPSLLQQYRFFLQVAEHFELDGYTEEDFYEWIVEPLLPVFHQLSKIENDNATLDAFFKPKTRFYALQAEGDSLTAVEQQVEDDTPIFGIHIADDVCSSFPLFKPSELQQLEERDRIGPPSTKPTKVQLPDGTVSFLKVAHSGEQRSLLDEVKAYTQIQDASLDISLRISRLIGIVRDEEGIVYGLLLTFIDCHNKTLFCAAKPGSDKTLRQKWLQQVTETVTQLHLAGIAWGDAKPDNVLIDRGGDAWLIDFGSSYTEGWVPRDLAGTIEGDEVGLQRMREFLV